VKIKLDIETLKAIWDASRPTVEKNKKKYDELSEEEKKVAFHTRAIDGIGE